MPLPRELAEWRPELTGVRGARTHAVAFADAWHAITGRAGKDETEERLYRLGTLRAPRAVSPVRTRLATDDDRGLLVEWVERFVREVVRSSRNEAAGEEFVDHAKRVR